MNSILKKFTSRKFWITLVSVVTGIAQLFGANGELVKLIGGILLSLIPSVAYIITEGKIDSKK